MALLDLMDWSVSKVQNGKELCWEPDLSANGICTGMKLNGVTKVLLYSTAEIGMNTITEKNFKEFHCRLLESSMAHGVKWLAVSVEGQITHRDPTLAEVYSHIGLSTNASTHTGNQWETQLMRRIGGRALREQMADTSMDN
jgi:hypothetical protein